MSSLKSSGGEDARSVPILFLDIDGVLTDGHLIEGTWSRETAESTPEIVDENGDTILLTPGQTWVVYPEAGQVLAS